MTHDDAGGDSSARAVLRRGRARPLWFGHPWVYGSALAAVEGAAEPGDVVTLVDHERRVLGRGLFNPRSQIPVRLLTRIDEPIDAGFLRRRIAGAAGLRRRLGLPTDGTDVYRLVNGEGDGLPGLAVDVFGDALAVQFTTLGLWLRREAILDALEAELAPATVYEIASKSYARLEGFEPQPGVARGAERLRVDCVEDGIRLAVEPLLGQKTGMFVDQRPNRIRVGELARAARVLDCYTYHGGFALQAARGGAAAVTAVDCSERAVAAVRDNASANELAIDTVAADAFRHLEAVEPESHELVIIDPPKFARARKDLEAARKGYQRLNMLAMRACAPGGLLLTCSCSQNVDAVEFERIVAAGAKQADRVVQVLERRGAGPDHPLPPGFVEGQYLKVLLVRVG